MHQIIWHFFFILEGNYVNLKYIYIWAYRTTVTVILFSEFNLIIVRHKGYRLGVRRILQTRIAIISRDGRYDWIKLDKQSRSVGHPRQLFFSGRHNPRGWCFTMQTALFSSTGVYRCYANNTIKRRANRVCHSLSLLAGRDLTDRDFTETKN